MLEKTSKKDFSYKKIQEKLLSGFFGFWVKEWKFTFLMMFAVILFGLLSMINIKKESTPEIDMGVVSITTIYQGASPEDIDNLITDKIEKEVKDIDGIDKINSSSKLGISNVTITLKVDADETQALVDIKDAVDKVNLPTDAEDPIVTKLTTNSDKIFYALIYGDSKIFTKEYILQKSLILKKDIEGKGLLDNIDIGGLPVMSKAFGGGNNDDLFKYKVLVDKKKLEDLHLSILQIVGAIKNWNLNQPLGTHKVGILNYEFRIQGEYKNIQDLLNTPISTPFGGNIVLKDIAKVKKVAKDENIYVLNNSNLSGQVFVTLTFNKKKGSNIFQANKEAQELLKKEFNKLGFKGLHYVITNNLADYISKDYSNLAWSGISTLILVFLALLLFVGFKEATIATIAIPLAFFVSFIVLEKLGLSLNFLTNFSFIVSFGIAIDTTLVIIEGAHEKMKQGFTPLNSILLAVRDYKMSVISGTATTVVVFIPLLSLPGTVGKFLAFIPITIFSTLLSALFFSLTINSALFYKLFKNPKNFKGDSIDLKFVNSEDKLLLQEDRKEKIDLSENKNIKIKKTNNISDKFLYYREKFLSFLETGYLKLFKKLFSTKKTRILSIIIPVIFLIASIVVLSKEIGFNMFPAEDKDIITFSIEGKKGTDMVIIKSLVSDKLNNILQNIPEVDFSYYKISDETINGTLSLYKLADRKKNKQRDIFQLEPYLNKKFDIFKQKGYTVDVSYPKNGPSGGTSIGIKLHTDDNSKFGELIDVAQDFKRYLQTLEGSKNAQISSKNNPGQFQYFFDRNKLLYLGLSPLDFQRNLYGILNGLKAGTLKSSYEDSDIEVLVDKFDDAVTPDEINNISVQTTKGQIAFGSVSSYKFKQSLDQISREDGKITLIVGADIEAGYKSDKLQKKLTDFASSYNFPKNISYSLGGEKADNQDLISSLISAFIFSLVVIFAILVLQFNSYSQPIIILFSVVMGMFGANLGLRLTGNSYGMMMGIGFISLTGIVVNDAIVLIDKINLNLKNNMPLEQAVLNAGKTRLQPVILTTLTTVLGLVSLSGNAMFQPLAVTIMFGLTIASAMTLFIIPIIYYEVKKLKGE